MKPHTWECITVQWDFLQLVNRSQDVLVSDIIGVSIRIIAANIIRFFLLLSSFTYEQNLLLSDNPIPCPYINTRAINTSVLLHLLPQ